MVPALYVRGFAIAQMDSRTEWEDSEDDYILKQLLVQAEQNDIEDWELVACVQVETVSGLEAPVEVYRMPFPSDSRVRIALLREMRDHPKFFEQ